MGLSLEMSYTSQILGLLVYIESRTEETAGQLGDS